MGGRTWRGLGEVVLALGVLACGLAIFGDLARRLPFHSDESHNLTRGRYFSYAFIERDLTRPEWGDRFDTHTHPPLMRYLIGGWLWARGHDLERLPPEYDWFQTPTENRLRGRLPDERLLAEARLPTLAMAAGLATVLYLLGRVLAGPVAGLAAAALALASPIDGHHWLRAVSDATLIFFTLLGLLLGVLGARRGGAGGSRRAGRWRWAAWSVWRSARS